MQQPVFAVMSSRWKLGLLVPALLLLGLPAIAQTSSEETPAARIDRLQTDLQFAVCRNDWQQALPLIDALIGYEAVAAADREALLRYRNQMAEWRTRGIRFANLPNCGSPAAAVPSASVLPAPPLVPLAALSPAEAIDAARGQGVRAGSVSTAQQVYSFRAFGGDVVTLNVNVTRMLPGRTFRDRDSQLFLFDSAGRLLSENDDDRPSYESAIRNFVIPADGTYFVVVTTFNNDPILDSSGIVTGWEGDGSSHIEYELILSGVTPTANTAIEPPQL